MQGFIKLHRKTLLNPVFKNANLFHLFIYCILRANHKETEIIFNDEMIKLKRGSFISGIKSLSKDLSTNQNSIYKRLQVLKKLEYITIESNNKFSIITVKNYEKYQNQNLRETGGKPPKGKNKRPAETLDSKGITETDFEKSKNQIKTKEKPDKTDKNDKNDKNVIKQKNKSFLNSVVTLFSVITNKDKELSYCYSIINKLLKLKESDNITYLQKCLMLIYIIKNNKDRVNENKYIGILTNQFRELSYTNFKTQVFNTQVKQSIPKEYLTLN
jgi:hypothetical protein